MYLWFEVFVVICNESIIFEDPAPLVQNKNW